MAGPETPPRSTSLGGAPSEVQITVAPVPRGGRLGPRIGDRVRLTHPHPGIRLALVLALVLVLGAVVGVLVVARGAAPGRRSAPRTAIASSRWDEGRVALNDRDLPRANGG